MSCMSFARSFATATETRLSSAFGVGLSFPFGGSARRVQAKPRSPTAPASSTRLILATLMVPHHSDAKRLPQRDDTPSKQDVNVQFRELGQLCAPRGAHRSRFRSATS